MFLGRYLLHSVFGKTALPAAALGGFLLFSGASNANAADRYSDCERRIARTQHRLHEAIEDHGYYSRQANHQRHELREAYDRCGYRDNYRYERRYRDWDRDYDRDRY